MEIAQAVEIECTCGRCGTVFTIVSATGPSELCDTCAAPLFAIIWRA